MEQETSPPWPDGFLDWVSLGTQYLSAANTLATEVRDREGWGTTTNGIVVPLYLFRHGLELALKAYSVLFNIEVKNSHDVAVLGKKISLLLTTLPTTNLEEANEVISVNLKEREVDVRVGHVLHVALKTWEKKLPLIIEKYQNHYYTGQVFPDPKNIFLRYPEKPELKQRLDALEQVRVDEIIKDIYDQFMLLQLVFAIKTGQPLKELK